MLRTFLYEHWIACPQGAWLSQLQDDVKLIALYVPSVQDFLSVREPVNDLLESLRADPTWWPRQARAADKAFQKAIDDWAINRQTRTPALPLPSVEPVGLAPPVPSTDPRPFACHQCRATFALRKHLGVHLARAHGILSPSRHFAFDVCCHSCHRWYGSVRQVQQHLKHSGNCLIRSCQVLPAMTA